MIVLGSAGWPLDQAAGVEIGESFIRNNGLPERLARSKVLVRFLPEINAKDSDLTLGSPWTHWTVGALQLEIRLTAVTVQSTCTERARAWQLQAT